MHYQPLITVIALCYNQQKFLEETLDSIRNQTYKNIELIICDDASTDNSQTKIIQWAQRNNNSTKLILNEKNNGITKALNHALKQATGSYISFIACDDLMTPDKLMHQLNEFSSLGTDYLAIYSDAQLIDGEGKKYDEKNFIKYHLDLPVMPTGFIFEAVKRGNFIPAASYLFKREVFDKIGFFDENLLYEDWDFIIRLSREYKIHYSDYVSIKYRFHSSNFNKSLIRNKEYFKVMLKHSNQKYFRDLCKNTLITSYLKSDPAFDEMLGLYISHIGKDWFSNFLLLKPPIKFTETVVRFVLLIYKSSHHFHLC